MLLLHQLILTLFTFFLMLLPTSYGKEVDLSNYDKGFLATEWSGLYDIVFAIIVMIVVLLIITFMKKPDDIV